MDHQLEVRSMREEDIPHLVNYWTTANEAYLRGMGADIKKMPSPDQFHKMLHQQLHTRDQYKQAFATIWVVDGEACGHSNVNKIKYGEEAYMHLHLWKATNRKKGVGTELVKKSLALFFEHLKLQTVWCEPYALNSAPNRVLEKVGFEFIKSHITVPGSINFEQEVNRWKMDKAHFMRLASDK